MSSRFTLENEDKGSMNCFNLHTLHHLLKRRGFHIPLVYDNLHDSCNPSDSLQNTTWLDVFKSTWLDDITPVMQLVEGGLNGNKRAHVQYITEDVGAPIDNSVVWELEVKAKDKAIIKLLNG